MQNAAIGGTCDRLHAKSRWQAISFNFLKQGMIMSQDNDSQFLRLSDDDQWQMIKLYEEVYGRLREMSLIVDEIFECPSLLLLD
jgi:hypothetical protein